MPIAWDTERGRWFTLNPDTVVAPDDWLHWTRNGQNWNGMCAECHSTNLQKNFDPDKGTYATTVITSYSIHYTKLYDDCVTPGI